MLSLCGAKFFQELCISWNLLNGIKERNVHLNFAKCIHNELLMFLLLWFCKHVRKRDTSNISSNRNFIRYLWIERNWLHGLRIGKPYSLLAATFSSSNDLAFLVIRGFSKSFLPLLSVIDFVCSNPPFGFRKSWLGSTPCWVNWCIKDAIWLIDHSKFSMAFFVSWFIPYWHRLMLSSCCWNCTMLAENCMIIFNLSMDVPWPWGACW